MLSCQAVPYRWDNVTDNWLTRVRATTQLTGQAVVWIFVLIDDVVHAGCRRAALRQNEQPEDNRLFSRAISRDNSNREGREADRKEHGKGAVDHEQQVSIVEDGFQQKSGRRVQQHHRHQQGQGTLQAFNMRWH